MCVVSQGSEQVPAIDCQAEAIIPLAADCQKDNA
jgi:hypothetical protein